MTVETTVTMVRDLLLGVDSSVFDDAFIQRQIDQGMYAIDIAILMAESQASLYASKVNMKVGSLSMTNSQRASTWMAIKKNLIYRKQTGSGLPNDGSATSGGSVGIAAGTVTGSSITTMEAVANDPDRAPNQFELGQFDNPAMNPTGVTDDELRG